MTERVRGAGWQCTAVLGQVGVQRWVARVGMGWVHGWVGCQGVPRAVQGPGVTKAGLAPPGTLRPAWLLLVY